MKEYEYYSVKEFEQALCSGANELLPKCKIIARKLIHNYSLNMEETDLFQEAITRVLENSRHIPKGISLVITIGKAMKGIAYDSFEKNEQKLLRESKPIDEELQKSISVGEDYNHSIDQAWDKLLTIFAQDEEALGLLKAISTGMKKTDIVSDIFQGDINRYDTIRRRIIRSGTKLKKEIQLW